MNREPGQAVVRGRGSRSAGEIASQCAGFEARCRRRGIRVTPQRQAVYRALVGDRTHPTAEAVHAKLRLGMSSLSLATVYRILESLEAEGLVRRVSTTGSVARFDANRSRHQHLVCRICGRLTDCEEDALSRVQLPRSRFGGFMAEEIDIRIVGTCQTCRRAAARRRRTTGKKN